jgi:hypothetical protein
MHSELIASIFFDKHTFLSLELQNCQINQILSLAFSKPLKTFFKSMFLLISVCGGYPTLSSWPEVVPTPGSGSSRWQPDLTRRPAPCRFRRMGSKSRHKSKTSGRSYSGTILFRKTTIGTLILQKKI